MFKTDDACLERVLQLLNKDKKSLDEDTEKLKKWMEYQPHLPEVLGRKPIVLHNFLIRNKFDIEEAKKKIEMYYVVRSKFDDVYCKINPKLSNMKELTDAFYLSMHPKLTDELCRLIVFKIRNQDLAEKVDFCDATRHLINMIEVRIREEHTYGEVFIGDFSGVSFKMQLKITPTMLYKWIILIYKHVYSVRVKAIYLLNVPSYGDRILSFLKNFIGSKTFSRIHICQDNSSLKQKIPIDILPTDFGGEGLSLDELQGLMATKFNEYQGLYDRLDNMKIDENLRPQKLNDDALGFYGNFKKLEID